MIQSDAKRAFIELVQGYRGAQEGKYNLFWKKTHDMFKVRDYFKYRDASPMFVIKSLYLKSETLISLDDGDFPDTWSKNS